MYPRVLSTASKGGQDPDGATRRFLSYFFRLAGRVSAGRRFEHPLGPDSTPRATMTETFVQRFTEIYVGDNNSQRDENSRDAESGNEHVRSV